VEVPQNIVSKCFFCGLIDFGDSWVPNWNWNIFLT
jgi:hypothetical protein